MPYKTDTQKLDSPFLKRTVKLLPCQKEMILYWTKLGHSQRRLAAMFHVSRRTITFIQDPDKLKENIKRRHERGGHKQYYDKEYNNVPALQAVLEKYKTII